jgi:CRP-like cAMP-binding protein
MTLLNPEDRASNRLLAHLPQEDRERLSQFLEPVGLEYKLPLYDADQQIDFVYFIETGVGSLVCTMVNGQAAEVGTVGNEGVAGVPVLLGDDRAPSSMYIQVPGRGLRINARAFREQLEQSGRMRAAMLRYTHVFFNQVAQSAACAHFHSLEQRCCRWLLMTRDRMPSDTFLLTQEFLAMMLGVRRSGVSVAAGALQRRGFIRYNRGRVVILDRQGLEDCACECYSVAKAEYDRLLGVARPRRRNNRA